MYLDRMKEPSSEPAANILLLYSFQDFKDWNIETRECYKLMTFSSTNDSIISFKFCLTICLVHIWKIHHLFNFSAVHLCIKCFFQVKFVFPPRLYIYVNHSFSCVRETRPNSIEFKTGVWSLHGWCHKRWSSPSHPIESHWRRLREWRMLKFFFTFETHNWHYCCCVQFFSQWNSIHSSYEIISRDCWNENKKLKTERKKWLKT